MAAAMEVHVKCPAKDVKKLLTRYPVLVYQEENNKVKCSLSSHEMPCKADVILSYVSGKKFLKLYKDKEFGYDKFEPHLIPSIKKRQEHLLFCKLTLRHINKTPKDVERHVNGKRYKKALARWQKCQETGETFKPLGRKRKKEQAALDSHAVREFWDSEEESKSESEMSDLYPDEDIENLGEEEMEDESDSNPNVSKEENKTDCPNAVTRQAKDLGSSEEENSDVETKAYSKLKKAQNSKKQKKTQKKPNKSKSL